MNASFVNASHCCLKTVGKYPIIMLWFLQQDTCSHICKHTHTYLVGLALLSPLSECAQVWSRLSQILFKKVSSPPCSPFRSAIPLSIPPYVPSLLVLSTPLSACLHPVLFIQAWPWAPHTPLEPLFSTNVSDERGSGCEGMILRERSPLLSVLNWLINAKLLLFLNNEIYISQR